MKKIRSFLVKVVSLLALVFAGFSTQTVHASQARTLDEIKESGTIKIGIFADKMPFGSIDINGDPVGFDVEIGKKIAEDLLGSEDAAEFVTVDAASRVEFLKSNKVDVILANFTVTPERREEVDYALPYMKVSLGVVSAEDNLITDVKELEDKKLILVKGTTAENYFAKEHPEIEVIKFDEYQEAYDALVDKRGDAFSTDNTEVLAWASGTDGFSVGIDSLGNEDTIAPAVQKGNDELKKWLDDEIIKLAEEGFLDEAYAKTAGKVYGDDVDPATIVVQKDELESYFEDFNYKK